MRVFGFDIGTTSVGSAVIDYDDPAKIAIHHGEGDYRIDFEGEASAFEDFLADQYRLISEMHGRAATGATELGRGSQVPFSQDQGVIGRWYRLLREADTSEKLSCARSIQQDIVNRSGSAVVLFPASKIGRRLASLSTPKSLYIAAAIARGLGGSFALRTASGPEVEPQDIFIAVAAVSPPTLEIIGFDRASLQAIFDNAEKKASELGQRISETLKAREEVEVLRKYLTDKLSTEAAVRYWGDVESSQGERVYWGAGLMAAGVFALPFAFYKWFQYAVVPAITSTEVGTKIDSLPVITFAIFMSIPLLLGAWLLRFPARVFVQALALRSDAQHRLAMIKTYLALGKETGVSPTAIERQLILQALFRPGPGDAADVTPHESVMNALGQIVQKQS